MWESVPILALALAGVLPCTSAAAAGIAPHRGYYSLSLVTARSGSPYADVTGAMTMVVEKICDGWIVGQDMSMTVSTRTGDFVRQSMHYAGWEAADGSAYRYVARSRWNDKVEESKGRAGWSGGHGEALIHLPEAKTLRLPDGTLFPLGHTAWLIEQARAGRHHAARMVFDGVGGEAPKPVSAFIGNRVGPGAGGASGLGPLTRRAGWPMRLAFHAADGRTATPEYEIEVLQLENGVAPRMVMDFGAFTVRVDMVKIEPIAEPDC